MSEQLARSAEKLKLARLLEADPDDLGYLDEVPALEIRTLRERLTDSFFDGDRRLFGRVATAARLVPTAVAATIAERAFGPLLCARVAASADPAKAIDIARRLSPPFLADTTVRLDPRRVAAIIAGVPVGLAVPVAEELGRRGEHVTMGRFLAFVPDEIVAAAMGALSDEALLRTAFVLEHKEALDHAVGLLPPDRLPGVLRCASEHDLWPEGLDLLDHLSDATRGPIADQVANLEPELVEGLVAAVSQQDLWAELLPVVGLMSPEGRLRLASRSAFHQPEILREIVRAGALGGLWLQFVPLLRALPPEAVAALPAVIAELDLELLREMLRQAVSELDALVPVLDLVADLDEDGRARVVEAVDGADRELGEVLVAELSDPGQVRLLLDHAPADVLAAVERAADRVGLRAEYDDAVTAAGPGPHCAPTATD